MTLYEVHSALARSLGDPFAETALSTIYDGVRYSKQARQNYLRRACYSIINDVVTQVAPLPREQGTEIIVSFFPSMISLSQAEINTSPIFTWSIYGTSAPLSVHQVAYVIGLDAIVSAYTDIVPIPILPSYRAKKLIASSTDNTVGRGQMNDPVAWITYSQPIVDDPPREMWMTIHHGSRNLNGYYAEVTYLRHSQNQELTDGTLEFDFESSYMNAVLNKATLYGMTDGGDLTPEQILPLLAK